MRICPRSPHRVLRRSTRARRPRRPGLRPHPERDQVTRRLPRSRRRRRSPWCPPPPRWASPPRRSRLRLVLYRGAHHQLRERLLNLRPAVRLRERGRERLLNLRLAVRLRERLRERLLNLRLAVRLRERLRERLLNLRPAVRLRSVRHLLDRRPRSLMRLSPVSPRLPPSISRHNHSRCGRGLKASRCVPGSHLFLPCREQPAPPVSLRWVAAPQPVHRPRVVRWSAGRSPEDRAPLACRDHLPTPSRRAVFPECGSSVTTERSCRASQPAI
jgi:hypothetical protein